MPRLSTFAWSLACLTFGVGAIGYAATGTEGEKPVLPVLSVAPAAVDGPSLAERLRAPDAVLPMPEDRALGAALLDAGTASLDAALASVAAGEPEPGKPVRLWFAPALPNGVRPLERIEFGAAAGRKVVLTRTGEDFTRSETTERVDTTPVRLRLSGGAELAGKLVEAGLPRDLRDLVSDRIGRQEAASVDLIVAHEQTDSGSAYGAPLYLGLHLADGSMRRWLHRNGALLPLGSAAPTSGLLPPVPGPVTSPPGLRFHPILRYLRWHRGTDFAAPAGTPVQAALGGRVAEAGWRGGYGRTVRLVHADGSATLYAHLRSIAVEEGAEIPQGAIIGEVGASGLATGPHLHFEWRRGTDTLRPAFASAPAQTAGSTPHQAARLQALLAAPFRLPPERRS